MATWQLQDAKNRFSAVVREAVKGRAQYVTRRGRPAVVVVATEEFDRLRRLEEKGAPSLAEMLLAIPRGDVEFKRLEGNLRDVDFGDSD